MCERQSRAGGCWLSLYVCAAAMAPNAAVHACGRPSSCAVWLALLPPSLAPCLSGACIHSVPLRFAGPQHGVHAEQRAQPGPAGRMAHRWAPRPAAAPGGGGPRQRQVGLRRFPAYSILCWYLLTPPHRTVLSPHTAHQPHSSGCPPPAHFCSWLGKLAVVKNLLVDSSPRQRPDLDTLASVYVYTQVGLFSGDTNRENMSNGKNVGRLMRHDGLGLLSSVPWDPALTPPPPCPSCPAPCSGSPPARCRAWRVAGTNAPTGMRRSAVSASGGAAGAGAALAAPGRRVKWWPGVCASIPSHHCHGKGGKTLAA